METLQLHLQDILAYATLALRENIPTNSWEKEFIC